MSALPCLFNLRPLMARLSFLQSLQPFVRVDSDGRQIRQKKSTTFQMKENNINAIHQS